MMFSFRNSASADVVSDSAFNVWSLLMIVKFALSYLQDKHGSKEAAEQQEEEEGGRPSAPANTRPRSLEGGSMRSHGRKAGYKLGESGDSKQRKRSDAPEASAVDDTFGSDISPGLL